MIAKINAEWEKSDRLTVAKLNTVKHFNKQDHKSKLMIEKYSLLPLNPQQLTPVQTVIQRMSEKHLDFEIKPVNTILPLEIEHTQMPQAGHQHPYCTAMTIRQKFFIHNLMNKVKRYIEACHTCLKTKPKYMKN